ncbi:helix-turn-helix domain-containing protein [Sinomicrobium sp. M5D2P17]
MEDKSTYTIPETLRPYVKSVLSFHKSVPEHLDNDMPFFADGCPGIMYIDSSEDIMLNDKKISSLFLYGQTVKPIHIFTHGEVRAFVFILYPHIIRSLFGIHASELTDSCIDFELLPFANVKYVREQLSTSASTEKRLEIMTGFLLGLAGQQPIITDNRLSHATSRLLQNNGELSLKALQNDMQISERTFERKFREHVGVSPRLYARICRFRSAMVQLQSKDYMKLTDIAYDNGYADQSHFIRTFQEFTGYTPSDFLTVFTGE